MKLFLQLLEAAGGVAAIIVLFSFATAFVFRQYVAQKILQSIKAGYEKELEEHKAALKSETDARLQAIEHAHKDRTAQMSLGVGAASAAQEVAVERRLDAVLKLWAAMLKLRHELAPGLFLKIDILTDDELRRGVWRQGNVQIETLVEFNSNLSSFAAHNFEELRPLVGERIWGLFHAYSTVLGRCVLLHLGGSAKPH